MDRLHPPLYNSTLGTQVWILKQFFSFAQIMARAPSANQPLRRSTSWTQSANNQKRQKRQQHRTPPKRSVNSLSATQLERKRANDREAQRLIRQRTKERIHSLERQISDLKNENERLNEILRQTLSCKTQQMRENDRLEAQSIVSSCSESTVWSERWLAPSQSELSANGLSAYL